MKKYILLFVFLLIGITVWSQVPDKMSYQTVVRNATGELVSNQQISIQINILKHSANGATVYSELHKVPTNQQGLATLKIGEGEVLQGSMTAIDWTAGPYFIQSATDINGGANFSIVGVSELVSVPYALVAKTTQDAFSGNYKDLKDTPVNVSEFFNDAGYITQFELGPGNGVPSQVWSLFGNSNTDPTKDKLGTTDYTDLVMVTNDEERLRISADGEIGIENDLSVGADLTVMQNVYLNTVAGETINNGNLTVANSSATSLTGNLDVDGATNLNSTLNVNNNAATDLSGDVNVEGSTSLQGTLDVNNAAATHLTGTLEVDGAATLNNTLLVNDATTITSTLNVSDAATLSSTLDVAGNTTVGGDFDVTGGTTLGGDTDIDGQVTIESDEGSDSSSLSSYPLRVIGGDNGIAVKVDASTPEAANNFITFFDSNDDVRGRIEGQTLSELQNSFDYIWWHEQEALNTAFQIAMVIVDLVGVDDGDAAVVEGIEMVDIISNWAVVTVDWENKVGVLFESGSGDYAEWLQKYRSNESFSYGDIVGVKAGMISKNLPNPDQYMVVSQAPIVLGNMPPQGQEANFEKVAFIGQVPVKVRGAVSMGDYILASELNDGFGYAVHPDKMNLDQYERIVGIAWSESANAQGVSMINVAIGINTNDTVKQLQKQQEELDAVKSQLNTIVSYLQASDPSFDAQKFDVQEQEDAIHEEEAVVSQETVAKGKKPVLQKVIRLLNENPEMVAQIQADARQMLDEKGINYNLYEQTRKMVTDANYFVSVLNEFNR